MSGVLIGISFTVQAQYNLVHLYDQHWNIAGARLLPSKLGMDDSRFQLLLPGRHGYAGTNSVALGEVSRITNNNVNKVADKLKFRTHAGLGMEQDLLAFSYKHIRRKKERYTVGLGVSERMAVHAAFPGDLARYLLRGNIPYAGTIIEVDALEMGAWHLRDHHITFVKPINTAWLKRMFQLRIATRVKYIQGFASAYLEPTDGTLFTPASGSFIDLNSTYVYRTAGIQGWDRTSFTNPVNGQGVGADLSVTGNFANLIRGSISVIDVGSVSFSSNTRQYQRTEPFRYTGQVSNAFLTGANGQFDTLLTSGVKGTETAGNTFSMPLPTRIVAQAEFTLDHDPDRKGNLEYGKKKFNKKYDKHSVYLTYVQGLNNMPGNSIRPLISAAYAYSWGYVLNMGTSVSYGGLAGVGIGAFVSGRVGPVRIGAGTSNFTGALLPEVGRGADFTVNAVIAF